MDQAKLAIYLVDDDDAVRATLTNVFKSAGFEVLAYASSTDFLDALPSRERAALLLDLRMPGMSGLELLKRLQITDFLHPVIIYTAYADVAVTVEALTKGAFTLIEKPTSNELLIEKVKGAIEKFDEDRVQRLKRRSAQEALQLLTPREREMSRLLAQGKSAKVIGDELHLSPRTVETHRMNIMRKLEVKSVAQLAQLVLLAELAD
ncbi:MAG: response regulator [Pseudohongiellaceae bacterium]